MKKSSVICCTLLAVAVCLGCGCEAPAWHIPILYSEEKCNTYYSYIKDELLTDLTYYNVNVNTTDENGVNNSVDIWRCGDAVIMYYSQNAKGGNWLGEGVYYGGTLKSWDAVAQTETVTEAGENYLGDYFENVRKYAEFLKTVVGTEITEGYFWEHFPWGYGVAQISYPLDESVYGEGAAVAAYWTTQKIKKNQKKPLVSEATFTFAAAENSISLQPKAEPFDIDERIEIVFNTYENYKNQ